MNTEPSQLRRLIYTLLIVVAAGAAAGRIATATFTFDPALFRDPNLADDPRRPWPSSRPRPVPTFGSNDRSRWATVRALVDDGTYVVGRRDPSLVTEKNIYGDEGIVFESGWETVDKVLHPEKKLFYSSKPPLISTLLAGEYWLLKHAFGWSFTEYPFCVVRTILLTINLLPLLVYLVLLSRLVERHGTTDWGRLYVFLAACFATFLTPFLVTLNNHTLATCFALFAVYPAFLIWEGKSAGVGERESGGATERESAGTPERESAGTPERESGQGAPALSRSRVPALFVLTGFFAGCTAAVELPAASFAAALFVILLVRAPGRTLAFFVPAAALPVAAFLLTNYLALGQFTPAYGEFGGPWYEYEGSHWYDPLGTKRGIDRARESKSVYAFHFLLGHHGLFSLSPIFLLSMGGLLYGWRTQTKPTPEGDAPAAPAEADTGSPLPSFLFPLTGFLFVLIVGFYLVRTNNYGGGTSGPRWLMWLTPFLLLTMLPIADRLARTRGGRVLGYVLLALSVFSVSYPALSPWRHPWIYHLMEAFGWKAY